MFETKNGKTLVRDLNEVLVCHLCRGYMINPTIVDNCYHSYCRSCIVRHLYGNSFCPECKQSPDPNGNGSIDHTHLKSDNTLRSLIYKLIPGLYHKERERSINYAAAVKNGQNIKLCDDVKLMDHDEDTEFFSPTEPISLSLEYHPQLLENCRATEHAPLVRYLQCPAGVKIRHLKRFLSSKYSLDPQSNRIEVEIMYADEVLPPEFTLMDVGYCYNWIRHAPMRFTYRILYFGLGEESQKAATLKVSLTQQSSVYEAGQRKDKLKSKPTKSVSFSDKVDLVSFEKTAKSKKSGKRSEARNNSFAEGPAMTTHVAGDGNERATPNAPVKVVIARNRSTATESKKQSPKQNDYRCENSTSTSTTYAISNSANDFKSLRSNDMRYSDYTVTSSSVITAVRKKDKQKGMAGMKTLASSHKSPEALVVVSIPRGAATNSSSSSSPSDDLFENMSLAQLKTANKKTTAPKPPNAQTDSKPSKNVPKLKIELNSLKSTLSIVPKCKSAEIVPDNTVGEPKKQKHRKHSLDEGFVSMSDRVDIKTYAKNIGLKPIDNTPLPSPSSTESLKYSPNASPMSSSGSSTASSNGNNHYALLDGTSSSSSFSFSSPPTSFHKKRKKKHSKDSKDSKRRKLHAEISSQPADESLKMKVKITPASSSSHYHHHHHHHHNQYKQNTYTIKAPEIPKVVATEQSNNAKDKSSKNIELPAVSKVQVETPVVIANEKDRTQPLQQQQKDSAAIARSPPPVIPKPLTAVKETKLPASPPLPPSLFKTTALPFPNLSIIQPAAAAAVSGSVATPATTASSTPTPTASTTPSKPVKEKEKSPPKLAANAMNSQISAPTLPLFVVPKTPANRSNSLTNNSKYFANNSNPSTMPGSIASALNKPGLHLKRSASLNDACTANKQSPPQPKSPEQDRLVRKTAYGAFFGNSQMGMPIGGIASAKYQKNSTGRRDNDEVPSYTPLSGKYTAEFAKRKLPTQTTTETASLGTLSTIKATDTLMITSHPRVSGTTTISTTTNTGYPVQLSLAPKSKSPKNTDIQALMPTSVVSSSASLTTKTQTPRLMGPPPTSLPKARKFCPLTMSSSLTAKPSGTIRSPPLLNVPHLSTKGSTLHLGHYPLLQHPQTSYRTSPPALINLRNTLSLAQQQQQQQQHKTQKLDSTKAKTLPQTFTTCLSEFRPTSGKEVHIQEILDLSSSTKSQENSKDQPSATAATVDAFSKRSAQLNATGNSLETAINILKQNMSVSCGTVETATKKTATTAPSPLPATVKPPNSADANREDLQNLHLLSESATAREKIAIKMPQPIVTAAPPFEKSKLLATAGLPLLSASGAAVVRQQNASVRSIPNPSALAFRNQPLQTPNVAKISVATTPSSSSSTSTMTTEHNSIKTTTSEPPRSSPNTPMASVETTAATTNATATGVPTTTTTLATPTPLRCPKKSTTIDQVAATLNIRAAEASAKALNSSLNEDVAATNSGSPASCDVNAKPTVTITSTSPKAATPSLSHSQPVVATTVAAVATRSPTTTSTSTASIVTTKTIGMGQTVVSLVEETKSEATGSPSSMRPPTPSITATSSPASSSSLTSIISVSSSSAAASPLTLTLSTEKSQITA